MLSYRGCHQCGKKESHLKRYAVVLLLVVLGLGSRVTLRTFADSDGDVWANKKSAWATLTPEQHRQVSDFGEDYKSYLNVARTAEGSTHEMIRRAKAAGFAEYASPAQVKPGARLIIPNRDRALILAVIGSQPIVDGSRVVAAHQDSPHIDLKARPIYPAAASHFSRPYITGESRSINGPTFRSPCWAALTPPTAAPWKSPWGSIPATRFL